MRFYNNFSIRLNDLNSTLKNFNIVTYIEAHLNTSEK